MKKIFLVAVLLLGCSEEDCDENAVVACKKACDDDVNECYKRDPDSFFCAFGGCSLGQCRDQLC